MATEWHASFRVAPPGYPTCTRTVHDRHCRIPRGYDPQHTDSDRPYTVDELAARQDGPHRFAYPDIDQYVQGWQLWRALRRDARLTRAEQGARLVVEADRLLAHETPEHRRWVLERLGVQL